MRIISGSARGRNLVVPQGETRPTMDRTREAVFSILNDRVRNASVLDLFAGSGAYALEALSRGAKNAHLVDQCPNAAKAVRQNAKTLGFTDQVIVVETDVLTALGRLQGKAEGFDLIFADPPYANSASAELLEAILPQEQLLPLLAPDGLLLLEVEAKAENVFADAAGLEILASRCYGTSRVEIYQLSDS